MAQMTIQQAFDLALQYHQGGRLPEAEKLYRQILAQQPAHADALHMLGVIAHQVGRHDVAVDLIRRAIAVKPRWPEAHYNLGNALKEHGQLDQAIAAFRQTVSLKATWPEAYNNLGNVLKDAGQLDEAIIACRQAIALRSKYPEAQNNLGNALREKGRLDQAIATFRKAIALKPNFAEAHNNLGNALKDKGELDQAVAAIGKAIALKPDYFQAHCNLGAILKEQGRVDDAIAAFGKALALHPGYAEAYNNLGAALNEKGRVDEAVAACRQALALKPHFPEALNNLGIALKDLGQLDQAIAAFRQALALNPNHPEAYTNLGSALKDKGLLDEAMAAFRQAMAIDPEYAGAYSALGNALQEKGQLDEAIAACRRAVVLKPSRADGYVNLGVALNEKGEMDQALVAFRQAIALKPNYPEAYCNLGAVLQAKGLMPEAIAAYRQALALKPGFPGVHGNLIYGMYYLPGCDAQTIAAELRCWNQQHAVPLYSQIRPHTNDRNPQRRLRIGYVSADFRAHVSACFLVPLLENHDPQQVELYAYAQVAAPDAMSRRLQKCFAQWRGTVGLSDQQVAQQIRDDQIDILVDLKVHSGGNRLLVFAHKPAPVQVTWLGYPGSTGLTAIDYRLSDPYLDPPGMDESVYAEQTLRLPDSFWCYDPLDDRDIPVNSLPALNTREGQAGAITFGSLNNFNKLNESLIVLWAQVLRQVENSRLLVLAPEGDHRQRMLDWLAREGIDTGRVEFIPRLPRRRYLEMYHRIDVCLDSHPVNGHTTSLDSFWMGVPVVTLVGPTAMGRAGWCQLSNLGLSDLAGQTPEQYVQIAVNLARDLPRLQALRATLRPRMEASPLMDAPRFAGNIEAAYRQFWHKWCVG